MTLTDNFKKEAAFMLEGYISHLKRTNFKELLGLKKLANMKTIKIFGMDIF